MFHVGFRGVYLTILEDHPKSSVCMNMLDYGCNYQFFYMPNISPKSDNSALAFVGAIPLFCFVFRIFPSFFAYEYIFHTHTFE